MATPQQQARAVLTYFENAYKQKYGKNPRLNRVTDKWGIMDILKALPKDRLQQLIDFYFLTSGNHSLQRFMYNYDTLLESLQEKEADDELRRKLRAESKQRVSEWKNKYDDKRSKTN